MVYIPDSGNYKFNFRVASERATSQLIIRIGEGNSFTAIDTVTITGTGGWQVWKTISSTAFLPEGRYMIRIYVRTGEFNTNWFEAVKAPVTGLTTQKLFELQIYPNPANDFVNIDLTGPFYEKNEITIYNVLGQLVKTLKSVEPSKVQIDISDLVAGLYYVTVKTNNNLLLTTKLIVN